jgi:hypothetical protein
MHGILFHGKILGTIGQPVFQIFGKFLFLVQPQNDFTEVASRFEVIQAAREILPSKNPVDHRTHRMKFQGLRKFYKSISGSDYNSLDSNLIHHNREE